jgi:RimJ/RimL family protein N-acetyltransferase
VLTGDRVTLRPVRPEDYELLYAWRVELATWGHQTDEPPYPMTLAEYVRGREEAALDQRKGVTFAAEVDGELVGRGVLFAFDELARNAELGVGLGPEHRGKGYGTEIVGLLLGFGFTYRHLHRIWLECTATNERAIRAYLAAGFVEEGRLREQAWVAGRYVDMVRMGILRAEWEARA